MNPTGLSLAAAADGKRSDVGAFRSRLLTNLHF
jgi:hypothetical protein